MSYQSKRSFVLSQLYSQAMIIALAALNTYFPQYLSYTFLIFIAISFLISFFTIRSQFRGPSTEQLKEIKRSKKLYEEDGSEVLRLMASDMQLAQEMKPLTRASILSIFAILITLLWYYLYFSFATNLTHDTLVAGSSKFLTFLIGYEVPYSLMVVVNINQRRASKEFAQIPRNYALFESGLVGQGVVIKFPTDEYEIKLESKRKFIELISVDVKKPMRIRLYSSKPDDLVELIKKHGLSLKS